MSASADVRVLALLLLGGTVAAKHCATRGSTPSSDPFEQMCYLLQRNRQLYDNHWSVASDHHGFANHISYHIVSLYKLGANASRMQTAFDNNGPLMSPAVPSARFIDDSNWKTQIGAMMRGQAANTSVHFSDYKEFFAGKVAALGAQGTFDWAFPSLVDGVSGDRSHPAISIGYYFESGDAGALVEGLAWLATGYMPLGTLNTDPSYTDMRKAMDATRTDTRLPTNVSMMELAMKYSNVMAEYDLAIPDAPRWWEVNAMVKHMSLAVLSLFASDGYDSFAILHCLTGVRAMQVTVSGLWKNPAAQAAYLRRGWQTVLYVYVSGGYAQVKDPTVTGPLPSWEDLASGAMSVYTPGESAVHLTKLVYLCRENYKLWGVPLYQQAAARSVALFQNGGDWKPDSPTPPSPPSSP